MADPLDVGLSLFEQLTTPFIKQKVTIRHSKSKKGPLIKIIGKKIQKERTEEGTVCNSLTKNENSTQQETETCTRILALFSDCCFYPFTCQTPVKGIFGFGDLKEDEDNVELFIDVEKLRMTHSAFISLIPNTTVDIFLDTDQHLVKIENLSFAKAFPVVSSVNISIVSSAQQERHSFRGENPSNL